MSPTTMTPEWLDQQFNNRARVADAPQILARWAATSMAVRRDADAVIDEPYGDDPTERLDLFRPRLGRTPGAAAPVLVFIHGGWWRSLDKSDHSFVAPVFTQAGALVVVPNYALCPKVSIEHITLQMVRALAWTWRHAGAHGGDPTRIVVVGHSAGAHLAAMLLSCRWKQVADDLPARAVGAALGLSGIYDLEPLRHSPYLQQDLGLTPAAVRRLSPAFFPRPAGRFAALVGGEESEEFLRQNQLIRDVWGPTSVPVCEVLPGRHHFGILDDLVDPAGRAHLVARGLLGLDDAGSAIPTPAMPGSRAAPAT